MKKILFIILSFVFYTAGFCQGYAMPSAPNSVKPIQKSYAPVTYAAHPFPYTPFTPTQIPGLKVWYDITDGANIVLSGANITTIKDKSGHSFNLSSSNASVFPQYHSSGGSNNLPYASFIPTENIYQAATGDTTKIPYTIYYVVKQDSFSTGSFIFSMDGGNTQQLIQESQGGVNTVVMQGGGSQFEIRGNGYSANWMALDMLYNGSPTTRMRINNEVWEDGSVQFDPQGQAAGNITALGFQPYYKITGKFSFQELLIYSNQVGTDNDYLLRQYLTRKYNPAINKTLLYFGDSITYGTAATNIYTTSWASLVGLDSTGVSGVKWNVINYGYPSSVMAPRTFAPGVAGHNGVDLAPVPLAQQADLSNTYVYFAFGYNDKGGADTTWNPWIASFDSAVNKYIAAGVPQKNIYICSFRAASSGGPASLTGNDLNCYRSTKQVAINTGTVFYDNWTYESSGPDIFVPGFLSGDGIHPTDAGMRAYANGLEQVMN